MNTIRKNITVIERKFNSLKAVHQLHKQPITISKVAQVITSGVIKQKNVQDFLKNVHSSPKIEVRQKVNQKWYELDFSQMVRFLDQVTQHQSQGKLQDSPIKLNSSPSPQKLKIKAPTNEVHQNPFIPAKIIPSIEITLQKSPHPENAVKQKQQEGYYSSLLMKSKSSKEDQISSPTSNSKVKQIISGLPQDFENLNPKQRYNILSKKYGKDKSILQKKFDTIYKHYRREMYIPYQSFEINNQLLMDLRIFLKYYREFQVSNRFKTNQAIQHFKKIALNGLWLDDKIFMQIHYKLVQLLKIDESLAQEENQFSNDDEADVQKANEKKLQISRKIKNLLENIVKIKELSDVVSENKIKQIFNNKEKNMVKKIIQAHSGLTKDDVMLKLQQRVEFRKFKKNVLFRNANQQRSGQLSPNKKNSQVEKVLEDPTQRLSPKKQSIYDELEIPKLRSRQLKKSSVYSSLQLMNIQKEKQKLKMLVNQRQNEQFLDAFFKKERQMFILPRTKSVSLLKYPNENQESTIGFTINSTKSIKNPSKQIIFQRNLSLPRMKFN